MEAASSFRSPARADGHVGHLVAVLLAQLLDQRVVVQQLQAVVDDDLDAVLVDEDLVEVVACRLSLQDDGGVAEPGQHLGGLAAGVGLLDGAGQRALAADRQPAGHGAGGAAQHAGGDDQLVLRPQRMGERVNLRGDDDGGHRPAAESGVLADRSFGYLGAACGPHVDACNLVHTRCSFPLFCDVAQVSNSPFQRKAAPFPAQPNGLAPWDFPVRRSGSE